MYSTEPSSKEEVSSEDVASEEETLSSDEETLEDVSSWDSVSLFEEDSSVLVVSDPGPDTTSLLVDELL